MKLQSKNLHITNSDKLNYLIPREIPENSSPAIFLHGFTGSASDWLPISKNLDERFYPVIPDLPGHGQTNVNSEYYSTSEQLKLVTKLLNSLKIEKACFVGYSMGGRLALQFAVNNPQMIKCLVLESSSPGIADDFERSKRIESDNKIIERIDKSTREEFLKFWLSLPIFQSLVSNSKINLEEIIKSRSQTLNKNGLIESLTYFGTGVMPHYHDQLSSLDDIPLLLIAGEHDLKYREILKKLHSEIKSSSFFTINDAGHNTHLENPAEFIKLLNRFLVDNC